MGREEASGPGMCQTTPTSASPARRTCQTVGKASLQKERGDSATKKATEG